MDTHFGRRRPLRTSLHLPFDPSRHRAPAAAAPAPTVTVERYWFGSWTILRVEGEMDLLARPLVNDLIGDAVSHVAFELDAVTFLDAGGLGTLIDRRRRAGEAGGLVHLIAPSLPVRRLLALTDTERLFSTIVPADRAVAVLIATDPWPISGPAAEAAGQ